MGTSQTSERGESGRRPAARRGLASPADLDSGLARAAADRWRQADGRLPESVARVTERAPITHAALFPPPPPPSRLRMALLGLAAALALSTGGGLLALLYLPGDEAQAIREAASTGAPATPALTAADGSTDGTAARASAGMPLVLQAASSPRAVAEARQAPAAPAPALAPEQPTPQPATPAAEAPAGPVDARWMDRLPQPTDEAEASAPAAAGNEGIAEALRQEAASAPAAAAPPPARPIGEDAVGAAESLEAEADPSGVRIVGPNPFPEDAAPLVRDETPVEAAPAPQTPAAPAADPAPAVTAAPSSTPAPAVAAGQPAATDGTGLAPPVEVAPPPRVATVPEAPAAASEMAPPAVVGTAPLSPAGTAVPPMQGQPAPPADASAALAPAPAPAALPQGGQAGRIVSPVNLRANGEKGSAVVGTVSGGTAVQVIGCDIWCEIVTPDGRHGFVYKDFVAAN